MPDSNSRASSGAQVGEDDVLQPHLADLPVRVEERAVETGQKARLAGGLRRLDHGQATFCQGGGKCSDEITGASVGL